MTSGYKCNKCGKSFMPENYEYDYKQMTEAMREHSINHKRG